MEKCPGGLSTMKYPREIPYRGECLGGSV